MKLKKKQKDICLDMLEEPALLFDEEGVFANCNEAARDFMYDLGYDDEKSPETIQAFSSSLHARFEVNGKNQFEYENWKFTISKRKTTTGTLFRLLPIKGDETVTRLSLSLNIMPWGIMTVNLDDDNKIVYCNPMIGEFLGVDFENIIGFSIDDVMRVCGVEESLKKNINDQSTSFYDHAIKVNDNIKWVRMHFVPFMGDYHYCMIVVQDTSHEKMKESQFSQAQRLEALGQLAGGVAHDFNNILSIIDGYARMVKKKSSLDETTMNYLNHISKAVERGSGLTSRLLTFGRHKISKDKILDLGKLIKDQEALISPLMDASIALSITVQEDVFIEAAPDSICQIFLNLCINSRDAMKNGGSLMVDVRKEEHENAVLEIIDTGCGMSPEVKSKMFDPFFTTKGQGKGTGLGLSMAYSLIKDMNGSIDVVTAQDEGTAIRISFPLSKEVPEDYKKPLVDMATGAISGVTALVAEDEPELLELVTGMMEEIGVHVIKAYNGNEALALQEEYEGEIDFLLTDVVMPELNGVRLAELFSACRPDSKVMFMSGYPANGQMARVPLPEGAFLMPKPINFENLKNVVASLLNNGNDNALSDVKKVTGEWKVAQ